MSPNFWSAKQDTEKFPCNSHPSLSVLLLRTKDQSLVCSSTHISTQMQKKSMFYIFLLLIQILTRLKAGGEGDDRGWDGWMALLTQWTWVWASSGSWWWAGKPGVLQSMGLQRIRHDWVAELKWTDYIRRGFSSGTNCKEPGYQCRRLKRCRFDPWFGNITWRRAWQPTPVFLRGIPWTKEPG